MTSQSTATPPATAYHHSQASVVGDRSSNTKNIRAVDETELLSCMRKVLGVDTEDDRAVYPLDEVGNEESADDSKRMGKWARATLQVLQDQRFRLVLIVAHRIRTRLARLHGR